MRHAQGPVTVRTATDGTVSVADGPVHAGEETLGGWFLLEVTDHTEAIELARSREVG
ncbi:hypothetical protein ACOKM3_06390 [Streptomyces sp. BH106]|uniref:hypothetical protein n=1 Tax=Streptomyces sp. BH106 TaxID=3410409 RepID=UPI003CF1BC31